MTIQELAQRYAEKPTTARYDVLRDAVLERELEDIKAEIEKSMETVTGTYNGNTPLWNKPSMIFARNDGRQQALDILKKHIGEVK